MWRTLAPAALKRTLAMLRERQPPSWSSRPDVVAIAALPIEIGGLLDLLRDVSTTNGPSLTIHFGATSQGCRLCIALTGPGSARARSVTETVLTAHRPRLVISCGFAGGLVESLAAGDLVLASTVVEAANGTKLDVPAAQGLADLGQVGVWVTVDRVAKEPTEKYRLAKKFQAIAVEMESYAVADVCRERELPFVAVRSISDTCQQSLPPHLDRVMQQGSATARAGRALGTLMRQPSAAADFCRLYAVAREAADNLARGLVQIAHRLPADDDDGRR